MRDHAPIDGKNRIGSHGDLPWPNHMALEAPDDDAYDLVIGVTSRATAYGEAGAQLTRWH